MKPDLRNILNYSVRKVRLSEQLNRMQLESEWSLKVLGKVTERTKQQVEQWKKTGKIN